MGNIQWQKTLGGTEDESPTVIKQTFDGGYIISGYSQSDDGDLNFHHGSNYLKDYWIVKLDSIGNIEWQKSLGGTDSDLAWSIQQTADSGFIVAGESFSFNANVTLNYGEEDFWVVKLSAAGSIQWEKSYGGSLSEDAFIIIQTSDGGFIIGGDSNSIDGDFTSNHGYDDFAIIKIDSAGILEWQKTYGGTFYEGAGSIQETTDNGYIIAGSSSSNDGDVTGHHGFPELYISDAWVVKIDSMGNIQWERSLGGTADDGSVSVYQTADNGFIIGGTTLSNDGDVMEN